MIRHALYRKTFAAVLTAVFGLLLSACGTYVPQLHEAWEETDVDDNLAYRIKKSIYCEIRTAVYYEGNKIVGYRGKPVDAIPDNWGAQMTITLKMDEAGAFNPGVNYTQTYRNAKLLFAGQEPITIGQNLNLGLNGSASSQATRTDTYYSFFNLVDMKKDFGPNETSCKVDRHGSSPFLTGNLGIHTWLRNAVETQAVIPSSPFPGSMSSKLDVLQYQVQFVIITNGIANPVFKLVDITASSNSLPLVSANRTRTHTLLLTMGPTVIVSEPTILISKSKLTTVPTRQTADVHFSAQVGQAVANGIKSVLP